MAHRSLGKLTSNFHGRLEEEFQENWKGFSTVLKEDWRDFLSLERATKKKTKSYSCNSQAYIFLIFFIKSM
jgi:hypothetical protein